jgi:hypothetical protein
VTVWLERPRNLLNTLAWIIEKAPASLRDAWANTTTVHGRPMLTVLGSLGSRRSLSIDVGALPRYNWCQRDRRALPLSMVTGRTTRVNSPINDDPDILTPLEEGEPELPL